MPITHITFLEPSNDPNKLCYIWVIQSDNTKIPTASMIALTYEMRIVMPNGSLSYRVCKIVSLLLKSVSLIVKFIYAKGHKESCIKFEMSFKRETWIGRCISALSLCNVNLARHETGNVVISIFLFLKDNKKNFEIACNLKTNKKINFIQKFVE